MTNDAENNILQQPNSTTIFTCTTTNIVITSPVVGLFIRRLGTKYTVCIGLAVAGTFTMLFGLSKDYLGVENPNQQYFFIIFAFLYGMGSTLADTGMLVTVEKMCTPNNLGRCACVCVRVYVCGVRCVVVVVVVGNLGWEGVGVRCR